MHSISRVLARVVKAGRIKHSFAIAIVAALFALPVAEALAYYGATGTGIIGNVPAASQSSTVSISGGAITFAGPSTTALAPSGTATFPLTITCTATPPCVVSGVSLQSWTSTKTGCDTATLPGSFTLAHSATFPITISTLNGTNLTDNATITFVNLPSVNQSACAGGSFNFTLVTP
jgi:hypothetical protein